MITILGSTGTIGINTLSIISKIKTKNSIFALTANRNTKLLFNQIKKYKPAYAVIGSKDDANILSELCSKNKIKTKILSGVDGLVYVSKHRKTKNLLSAIVGAAALIPTLAAIKSGKKILLANKESLIMSGSLMTKAAKKSGATIIPVDSEHSAIFQCLNGENHKELKKIILTGSGGPFLETPIDKFNTITPDQALKHPNWDMGAKISIDSATMMNKALELIEALWLFNIKLDKIQITIHPQSIVHSMVEFVDGSYKAHLGLPDMKVPIQYALTFPNRTNSSVGSLDFENLNLDFRKPDLERYPILSLVEELINLGGNRVAVMSMANDYIVERFLDRKISFNEIFYLIQEVVNEFASDDLPSLEELFILDKNIQLYLNPN